MSYLAQREETEPTKSPLVEEEQADLQAKNDSPLEMEKTMIKDKEVVPDVARGIGRCINKIKNIFGRRTNGTS